MGYSGAILRNSKGEILFQLRDEKGRNPNKWAIFGGGIEENETPLNALIREINEELGIKLTKRDIIKHHKFHLINYNIFEVNLKRRLNELKLKEGKDMKFMTKEEFLKKKEGLWIVKIFLRYFLD